MSFNAKKLNDKLNHLTLIKIIITPFPQKSCVPNNNASEYLKLKLSDIQKQYDKTLQLFQL